MPLPSGSSRSTRISLNGSVMVCAVQAAGAAGQAMCVRAASRSAGFGDGDGVAEALAHHAAQEAARHRVVFQDQDLDGHAEKGWAHLDGAAAAARALIESVLAGGLRGPAFLLNVNMPNRPDAAACPRVITRLGRRHASEPVVRQQSPRGDTIYWIGPAGDAREAGQGTDFHAVAQGQVSLTPLQVDLTDHAGRASWAQRLGTACA
jgi:5'-nucleotidase